MDVLTEWQSAEEKNKDTHSRGRKFDRGPTATATTYTSRHTKGDTAATERQDNKDHRTHENETK